MRSFTSKLGPEVLPHILQQYRRSFSSSSFARARIDSATKKKFIDFVNGQSKNPYDDYASLSKESGMVLESILSPEIKHILSSFKNKSRSVILLEGSPIFGESGLPPTPNTFQPPENKDYVSELWMLGISYLIGASPYLIDGVRDGKVITQLIPLEPKSNSGSGSVVPFNLHNEVVHEPIVPESFMLLCLRGNPMAKTNYCFIEDIVGLLPSEIIQELEQPNFLMKSGDPKVFKEAKQHQCPILTKDEMGNYQIRLNTGPGRCEGLTDGARIALKYLTQILDKDITIHGVALEGGNLLLANNKMTLHGRSSFDSGQQVPEGEKRWVQRVNLIKDKTNETGRQ
ncbi:MAG: hypothetical protein ACJA02_001239 [Myxococcota bacterium]|jgi:hypothetical protein